MEKGWCWTAHLRVVPRPVATDNDTLSVQIHAWWRTMGTRDNIAADLGSFRGIAPDSRNKRRRYRARARGRTWHTRTSTTEESTT